MKHLLNKISIINFVRLFGVVLLVVLFSGCSEELEPTPSDFSIMLTGETQKTWRLESFEYIYDDESLGSFEIQPDCVFAGRFTFFRKGKVLEILDNCDPTAEPEPIGTTWGVNVANSTFVIGAIEPFDLKELSATTLRFGFTANAGVRISGTDIVQDQSGFVQYTYKVRVE